MGSVANFKTANKKALSSRLVELENQFKADGGEFREISLNKVFDISTPKKKFDANKTQFGGKFPYVARGDKNNGIRGYISEDEKYLNDGNTISFGQDTATMFYQPNAYFTGDKIKIFTEKTGYLNRKNASYFISVMKRAFSLFSWGSSLFNEKVLNTTKIVLPYQNNQIAFAYMEKVIELLEAERLEELEAYLTATGLSKYTLSKENRKAMVGMETVEWKAFKVVDLFNVQNTRSILSSWITSNSGSDPYVTAGEGNNSINTYISYDETQIEAGNSIFIGGKTMVVTYQKQNYYSNDSHNLALYLKDIQYRTKLIQLFLVTTLSKSLKPIYSWGNSISNKKIQSDIISLPVDQNGNPNYSIMNDYMEAVHKLVIEDVVKFADERLNAYREVVQG